MSSELNPRDPRNHLPTHFTMEPRMRMKNMNNIPHSNPPPVRDQNQYQKPFPHGLATAKKQLKSNYFSIESMIVLLGLTASLLILPLVLPPLPPPPSMLLLLPIGILGLLLFIAFMPTKVRDLTYM